MIYGIIYKSVNKVNKKPYIGQTTDPLNERISRHFYKGHVLKGQDKSIFHKALLKYGKECFDWAVICECQSKTELDEKENLYIRNYNSHYKEGYGYNMTYGGEGSSGFKHSEESKKRMSESKKGKSNSSKGKKREPLSLATRLKISISNTGKISSEKTKEKIRRANLGKHHTEETKEKLRKRIFTEESRRKMSSSRMGKSPWNKGVKVNFSNTWRKAHEKAHSKTYEVNNNGEISTIQNLSKYCRNMKINKSSLLSAVRKGDTYRGIFIKIIS